MPPDGDVVVPAARSFADLGLAVPAVTIGPQTTAVAQRHGLEVLAEAETQDLEGLIDAVERVASRPAS
jgi:uroporphyrinogen-III synthase